jgi:hypothetical protein
MSVFAPTCSMDCPHALSARAVLSTVPAPPSSRTISPVLSHWVTPLSETTHGTPISRATMAECDSRDPRSAITPAALANTAIQPGSVCRATRISPGNSASTRGSSITRTFAVTTPLQHASPLRISAPLPERARLRAQSVATPLICAPRTLNRSGGSGRASPAHRTPHAAAADQRFEIAGQRRALYRAQQLFNCEIEHIPPFIKRACFRQPRAHGKENAPHAPE